jgi:lipid II:glycine glycyltransferase (peptidoglycan interpeptide bridge formation enzyme)
MARVGRPESADAEVVADASSAPADWDLRAVAPPGGHAMQSAAWARYRAERGLEPHFLGFGDGAAALALLRRSPLLPGVEAVVRRGPAHRDEPAALSAARAAALAGWAADHGARDLFLDPERPFDPTYEAAMEAAGFHVTDGLEPSIHVMRLDFGAGQDEATLLAGCSKSTRQRIRAAEQAGIVVREDPRGERLDELVVLLRERASVLDIPLQQGSDFLHGWHALLDAGLARLLVADHDGELIGGLFLYRHGGIHATAYSADRASARSSLPGAMHLVRWTAIRDALHDGAAAIELGGVDLPGHRRPPGSDAPMFGLYEHKRSFGARWQERSTPRRIVLRPGVERLARTRRVVIDRLRRLRG